MPIYSRTGRSETRVCSGKAGHRERTAEFAMRSTGNQQRPKSLANRKYGGHRGIDVNDPERTAKLHGQRDTGPFSSGEQRLGYYLERSGWGLWRASKRKDRQWQRTRFASGTIKMPRPLLAFMPRLFPTARWVPSSVHPVTTHRARREMC